MGKDIAATVWEKPTGNTQPRCSCCKDIALILSEMQKAVDAPAVVASSDPFKVLISTVLSQRTRDRNTERAAKRLFAKYSTATALATAPLADVRKLIRQVGFFKVKAVRIKEISRQLLQRFNGRAPTDMESLLSLPGVGRKTANCVLVYGFGIPCIPCDVHVMVISQRLGLTKEKTPDKVQMDLESKLPKRYWSEFNHLCVKYGQSVCHTYKPKCNFCKLKKRCYYFSANKTNLRRFSEEMQEIFSRNRL